MNGVKRDLLTNFVASAWLGLITFIFTPVYVHYLGLEAYGLIGLLAALQNSLGPFDLSIGQILTRELAQFNNGALAPQPARDTIRSVEIIGAALAAALVFAIAMPAGWIAHAWLGPAELPLTHIDTAIEIMALIVGLRLLEGLYRGAATALHRQVALNVVSITCVTLKALGALGLFVFVTRSVTAFFAWQAAVSALNVGLLVALVYVSLPAPELRGRFSWTQLERVWPFAFGLLIVSILAIAVMQTDKLLLSSLLPLASYGAYTLAATMAAAPHLLGLPILQSTQPRMANALAAGDQIGLAHLFHGAAQLMTVAVGSASIVIIMFSADVLTFWLHDAALAARLAPTLRILAFGSMLNALVWLPQAVQLIHAWTGLIIRVNAVAVAMLVPALLLIAPRYGIEGAAWLWVAFNLIYFVGVAHLMFQRILTAERTRWQFDDIARPLLTASIIAAVFKLTAPVDAPLWGRLLWIVAASAATLAGAAVAAPLVYSQARAMAAAMRQRYSSRSD